MKYLLFSSEAKLTARWRARPTFAKEFAARGPFDTKGRSLRQFDLKTRLFKYPCSYLIYSQAFAELPKEVKDYVFKRLNEILTGKDTSEPFAHLSVGERGAVLEILRETMPGFPK